MARTNRTEPRMRGNTISESIYEFNLYTMDEVFRIEEYCRDNHIKFAYILHDKDINDDGTKKKLHWHFDVFFEQVRSIKKVSEEYKVPLNLIEWKADKIGTIQYLVHRNHPLKYQYQVSNIVSNMDIDKYFIEDKKSSETDDLRLIMDYIANKEALVSLYQIYCFAIENDIWSSYRRNYSIIKDILKEAQYTHSEIGYFTKEIHIDADTGEISL